MSSSANQRVNNLRPQRVRLSTGRRVVPRRVDARPAALPAGRPRRGDRRAPAQEGVSNPPPAVPAAVHSEQVPRPAPRMHVSFIEAADAWMVETKHNSLTYKHLVNLGFTPRLSDTIHEANPHARQAAERAIATARALGILYRTGARAVIGLYGNERDERIVSFCNRHVAPHDVPMTYRRYSPCVTARDALRNPTEVVFGEVIRTSDAIFCVDVYKTDLFSASYGNFNPQFVVEVILRLPVPYGNNKLVWVGRKFYGDADTICGEGGWIRRKDGQVTCKSSVSEGDEYTHDPCDWIWQVPHQRVALYDRVYSLHWTQVKVIGGVYIVSFHLSEGLERDETPLYTYKENLLKFRCPDYNGMAGYVAPWVTVLPTSWIRNSFLFTDRYIFHSLWESCVNELNNVRYGQVAFSRAQRAVTNAMSSGETALFYSLFPSERPRIDDSLIWGLLTDDAHKRWVSNQLATTALSSTMYEVNQMQSSIGAPPSPSNRNLPLIFAAAGTALALGYVAKKFASRNATPIAISSMANVAMGRLFVPWPFWRWLPAQGYGDTVVPKIASGVLLNGVLVPVVEETIKKALSVSRSFTPVNLAYFFGMNEFCSYMLDRYSCPPYGSLNFLILARLAALWMHTVTTSMPWWKAVLFHSVWNVLISPILMCVGDVYYGLAEDVWLGRFFSRSTYLKLFGCGAGLGLLGYGVKLLLDRSRLTDRATQFEWWRYLYYHAPWEQRQIVEVAGSFSSQFSDTRVPEQTSDLPIDPDIEWLLDDPSGNEKMPGAARLSVLGCLPRRSSEPLTPNFHQLLPTCAPGFVPQSNDQNLRVAIAHRLLTPPPMDPAKQAKAWMMRGPLMIDIFIRSYPRGPTIEWDLNVNDWVMHFSDLAKRKSYRRIVEGILAGNTRYAWQREEFGFPSTTELFVKHDEMLFQQEGDHYKLKPRIIANVCPEFQAAVGPYVYAAQKFVSSIWHTEQPPRVYNIEGKVFTFHVVTGGGRSDEELSDWMNSVLNLHFFKPDIDGYALLVCGDDSVVARWYNGKLTFKEGDARMFDQSQSFGPLCAEYQALQHFGVPQEITGRLGEVAANTYVVRPYRKDRDQAVFQLGRKSRPMRDTGGADTYIGNTLVMSMAWFSVVAEAPLSFSTDDCIIGFKNLGFDMKMSETADYRDVTFLKGMWYPMLDKPIWGPLPSRILKMGKSLSDPRKYYPDLDLKNAARRFLGDVASSYAVFLPVPIIRAFCRRYKCQVENVPEEARVNRFGAQASGNYADYELSEEGFESVCRRYEITRDDILSIEKMIIESDALTYLSHPAFLRLALVDYR